MVNGSCLCGQIRYEIHGTMGPITHCHCPTCRKAHASAFSSVSKVELDDLVFTAGESLLKYFESSPGKRRYFCSNCGSQIYAKRDDQNHYIFRMGTIDGDPEVRPAQHIFMRYKATWYSLHDNIPAYHEWAPQQTSEPDQENNHSGFYEAMQQLLTQAKNRGTLTSLLLLNINMDEQQVQNIIESVHRQIHSNIRNSDQVEPLGSSAFAILLPYTGESAAMVLAERIRNTVRSHNPNTRISIGAATCTPDLLGESIGKHEIDKLLQMAETASQHSAKSANHAPCHYDKIVNQGR